SDQRAGTIKAAASLQAAGRKRPLIITGGEKSWTGREQVAGLMGFEQRMVMHTEQLDQGEVRTALRSCDAVVANIHDIPMILRLAREEGVRVPRGFSLISVGDDPFLEFTDPPVTAGRTRPDLVGARAVDILLRKLGKAPDKGD